MIFKNSLKLFVANFSVFWKLLLYKIIMIGIEKEQAHQQIDDAKEETQKLKKEHMKSVAGGSYEPDTEQKDDDILLPEI